MKKLIAFLLLLVTVLSFAACGEENPEGNGQTPGTGGSPELPWVDLGDLELS